MEDNKITNTNATPPPHPSQASAQTPQPPPQRTPTPPPYQQPEKPQPTEPHQCVNKGRPVWISYAPNSDEKPEWNHIADCVEQLTTIFKEQNIEYCINDTAEDSANISDYEQHIGWDSDVIVLVFSDKYFRSLHCMYEFVQIKKAIKKYPQKRLFCIKSGDFNLSDINYILDLEHFCGDQKQEYDEVSAHNTRPITSVEEEAHSNGFYMADIRSLYSFFSTLNYANANSKDWNEFAKEIANCYTSASKVAQLTKEKKQKRKTSLKFMGCGCLTWILVLIILFIAVIAYMTVSDLVIVDNPVYTKEQNHTEINKILRNRNGIYIEIKLNNPYDKDTVIYASRGWYLETNGKQYHIRTAENIPMYPEYKVLAAHQSIEYSLTFDGIPEIPDSMSLIMSHEIRINGIRFIER